jgi:hypothetical protein
MQLFKNESLMDTGFAVFDLDFGNTRFGPRYGRRSGLPRAFALSSAGLGDGLAEEMDRRDGPDWSQLENELQIDRRAQVS